MKPSTIEIVNALKVLTEAALTAAQVKALLEAGELTEEQVDAALRETDQAIEQLREDDAKG